MVELQNKEIKKHVAAIHVSNSLTFTQQKAANVLLLNAYDDLLRKEKHSIRITDLAKLIGFESHNQDVLKEALRGLMRTVLEWNLLDDNGEEDGWEGCPMLSGVRIQRGWCTYMYSEILREKLYNPEIYARINLAVQTRFSSGYALSLYENCVRFRKVGSTGWISLDIYRKLMGIPEARYLDFKRLSARVIRDPIQQVNRSSDIHIEEPEYKREKRKVTAVRFAIRDNPQMSLFRFGNDGQERLNFLISAEEEREAISDEEVPKLVACLLEYGITKEQTKSIVQKHDEQYIQDNLTVVDRDYRAGKVKNLPAYTLAALKDDYRAKKSPYEIKQVAKKASAKKKAEMERYAHERIEALRKDFQNHRLQQALDQLSLEESKTLQDRFQQKQKGNSFFLRWMKEGFEHRVVQALYRSFAAEELLAETTDQEFSEFIGRQGEDFDALKKAAMLV